MAASWYVAPSVKLVFAEVNYEWPDRSKRTDGTIGNAEHAARLSDHNPNQRRSVNAGDITSVDIDAMLVITRLCADPRTNYVIHKRWIWSRSRNFVPRRYYGANAHTGHIHFSIFQARWAEQDLSPWGIRRYDGLPTAPKPSLGLPSTGASGSQKKDTLSSTEYDALSAQIAELNDVVLEQTRAIANNGFARKVRDAMSADTVSLFASTGFSRDIIERNAAAAARHIGVILDAKFAAMSALLHKLEENEGIGDADVSAILADVEATAFKASKAGVEAGADALAVQLTAALTEVISDFVYDQGKDMKPEQLVEVTDEVVREITERMNVTEGVSS